ncbi:MAG: metalloregulator ArsR/SmtB family transcription factor [Actinomycetia bacterium]|nr:metalloregulator ArsR/SmtB family transcription factor [Actinomycetes bacterium]
MTNDRSATAVISERPAMERRVAVFKALADPYRLQILSILSSQVRCNCHLQDMLDLAPNLLSYHLKVLRTAGLIIGSRRGRWIDYAITDEARELVDASLPSLVAAPPDAGPLKTCDTDEDAG